MCATNNEQRLNNMVWNAMILHKASPIHYLYMLRWSQSRAGAQQTLSRRALGRLPVNNITKQPLALTCTHIFTYSKWEIQSPSSSQSCHWKKKIYLQQHWGRSACRNYFCGTLAPEAGAYSLESPLAELHGFLLTPAHMNEMKILYWCNNLTSFLEHLWVICSPNKTVSVYHFP